MGNGEDQKSLDYRWLVPTQLFFLYLPNFTDALFVRCKQPGGCLCYILTWACIFVSILCVGGKQSCELKQTVMFWTCKM